MERTAEVGIILSSQSLKVKEYHLRPTQKLETITLDFQEKGYGPVGGRLI